jgi:hypothetical protein
MTNQRELFKKFKKPLNYKKNKKFSFKYFSESFYKIFRFKNHFFISNLLDPFKKYNEQSLKRKKKNKFQNI